MNIFTQSDYEKLELKLFKLQEKRKKAVANMELARQEGDLSENSAYHQLKDMVTLLTGQIEEIEDMLTNGEVVEKSSNGLVELGSKVSVEIKGNLKELEIVGDGSTDPLKGKISYQSPIGAGLMGKKVGEIATVVTPGGEIQYKVVKID